MIDVGRDHVSEGASAVSDPGADVGVRTCLERHSNEGHTFGGWIHYAPQCVMYARGTSMLEIPGRDLVPKKIGAHRWPR